MRCRVIPKPDGRPRALGIAALEDKVVQRALVEVLNADSRPILGARTYFLYDTTDHVFPIEVRDPLYVACDTRHKTTALWDAVWKFSNERKS